jgi:hypothetical protein
MPMPMLMPSYVNHVLNLLIAKTEVEIIGTTHSSVVHTNTQACTHDE